jgi:hypothetical protein
VASIQALAEQYGISDKTVKRTLESCGLDPKQELTDEAIARFEVARTMLTDEGKNYRDVSAHFGVLPQPEFPEFVEEPVSAQSDDNEPIDAAEMAVEQLAAARDSMNLSVAQTIHSLAEESVKEVAPFVPAIVAQAINQSLTTGEIKESLEKVRQRSKGGRSSGVDFLLQKMQPDRPQLTATEQKQLPDSTDSSVNT